jgi:hypothetical protein
LSCTVVFGHGCLQMRIGEGFAVAARICTLRALSAMTRTPQKNPVQPAGGHWRRPAAGDAQG